MGGWMGVGASERVELSWVFDLILVLCNIKYFNFNFFALLFVEFMLCFGLKPPQLTPLSSV